jgi:nitroimidazol reductase NimA-like FMN-containing flavoprotein (pyridoxamine 5'-phosphate oxidase superfamily)
MVIQEMSRDECLQILAKDRLARLGCCYGNQPYVIPVYLVYEELPEEGPSLYGFTTRGQKVEWMRANPRVCVEVDDVVAHDTWTSVIAFGDFEELPDSSGPVRRSLLAANVLQYGRYESDLAPAPESGRMHAYQLIQTQAEWWEPGCTAFTARNHSGPREPFVPVYYRIRVEEVTGRRAIPDLHLAQPLAAPVWKAEPPRG